MSTDEPRRLEPFDLAEAWKEIPPTDGLSMMTSLVHHLLTFHPTYHAFDDQLITILLDNRLPVGLSNELTNAEHDLRFNAIEWAAELGWAFHATWTGQLEDIDSWAKRACEAAAFQVQPMVGGRLVEEEPS